MKSNRYWRQQAVGRCPRNIADSLVTGIKLSPSLADLPSLAGSFCHFSTHFLPWASIHEFRAVYCLFLVWRLLCVTCTKLKEGLSGISGDGCLISKQLYNKSKFKKFWNLLDWFCVSVTLTGCETCQITLPLIYHTLTINTRAQWDTEPRHCRHIHKNRLEAY